MARWAFVQAMVESDVAKSCGPTDPLLVCFRHTMVTAENESGAYRAGHKWSDAQNNQGVSLLNDYVFEV